MSVEQVIRAWRDEEYREELSATDQASLMASPIGEIELSDAELEGVDGGTVSSPVCTIITISIITYLSIASPNHAC